MTRLTIALLAVLVAITSTTCFGLEITDNGITWTITGTPTSGEYITGSPWVVGPVEITSINRPADDPDRDGTMINPAPGFDQGYDERWGIYVAELNVANSLPLIVQPGSSVISTISIDPTNTVDRVRPILSTAAILTVVTDAPSATAFRPGYAGTTKTTYDSASLTTPSLRSLATPNGVTRPNNSTVTGYFANPWVDHYLGWNGDDFHPQANMPNYGGAMALQVSEALMMLHSDIKQEEKTNIILGLAQLGIDNYSVVSAGGHWGESGGSIGVGRKAPILLAGIVLSNESMTNITNRDVFMEDAQIFYLSQSAKTATYNSENCSGSQDYCHPGWYDQLPNGTAVWGERAYVWETTDYKYLPGKIDYEATSYNSMQGVGLFMRLSGLTEFYNYVPFFDWLDRRHVTSTDYKSDWVDGMWSAYRYRKNIDIGTANLRVGGGRLAKND